MEQIPLSLLQNGPCTLIAGPRVVADASVVLHLFSGIAAMASIRLANPLKRETYDVQYQGFWKYLGYRFTDLHPLRLGKTWWFHTSPLNLVPPQGRRGR